VPALVNTPKGNAPVLAVSRNMPRRSSPHGLRPKEKEAHVTLLRRPTWRDWAPAATEAYMPPIT
jgi:hypothetical protein